VSVEGGLPGYTVKATIAETRSSLIRRAVRDADGKPVVLKAPRHSPTAEQQRRLRREYDTALPLGDVPGVVGMVEFVAHEGRCAMVMEDVFGASLDLAAEKERLGLRDVLTVSIALADVLGRLHARHVMHKDVNPSNVVWNRGTGAVRLIDFGLATELRRETPPVVSPSVLQGTLAYMSPEQTGRMNRSVDWRTDLYSFGATLYRLLTGRPPFPPGDAMAMVHAHLARVPAAPHEVAPDVPEVLSHVTLKLMAKRAEDRYQGAFALRDDLQACLDRLAAQGRVDPFPLAADDVPDRFQLPQRLYGREAEIAGLLAAFDRTCRGSREMVLVAGYSGIGKSTLVHEVQKPIVEARGAFIAGKFDQLSRNIPYASLIQAFQALVRQLLAESEEKLARWREKLLAALGPNARVMVEVIREVELIVGPQPPLPELPPAEAQNRFDLVVEAFVRTFATADHPLVLFLDDLQWADAPSLRLLEALVSDLRTTHLLVIGAYRDNEVDASHPLMLSLAETRRRKAALHTLTLAPLGLEQVVEFVADTVRAEPGAVRPLAELCARKTGGNPFFLGQFLRSLHEAGHVAFDGATRRWAWDLRAIEGSAVTENVVELMARKIHRLPDGTRRALTTAACIGNVFDVPTLALVRGEDAARVAEELWGAVLEELLLPLNEERTQYRFLHDRVQQAAYSLLEGQEKEALHLRIGRALRGSAAASVFTVANHLNLGSGLLVSEAERDDVAALDVEAARKATVSAAHPAALAYLEQALVLLGPDPWSRRYELALAAHVEAAVSCQLLGNFEAMEGHAALALRQARTVLEKVKVYETRYQAFVAQRRFPDAIAAAREVLALLGERLPEKPRKPGIVIDLLRTKAALAGRSPESLVDLPPMTDPVRLAAMRILARAASAAYIANPNLFPLIVFRMIRLSVRHGNTGASSYGYAVYGIILCGVVGDLDGAYRFGKLSLAVLERHAAAEYEARTRFISAAHLGHWKDPVHQRLDSFRDIYQRALDTGDLEFAAWALMIRSMHQFFVGTPLPEAAREAGTYVDALQELKHESGMQYTSAVRQAELCLMGEAADPSRLQGAAFDGELMLPVHRESGDLFGACNVHLYSLVLGYWFGRHREALDHALLAERDLETVAALLQVPVFNFYDSLNRLALAGSAAGADRREHLRKVAANQKRMADWSAHAPANHLHRYTLVEAERARVAGRTAEARRLYRKAALQARDHNHPHEEGLAHELLARFWEAGGETEQVLAPLSRARELYTLWGAAAKVAEIDRKLKPLAAASPRPGADLGGPAAGDTLTIQAATAALDLEAVLRASQAISGEVVLHRLLETMIRLVVQNAGAERGVLLLERDGHLRIEAEGTAQGDVTVGRVAAEEQASRLAMAVVNYVGRTGESVVLEEGVRDPRFGGDPYLQRRRPRSLLCVPVLGQGRLQAVIYLENDLAAGAFTAERVKTLSMLAGQIAISIGHAELVESLEQKVEERTRSLRAEKERTEKALAAAEEQGRRAEEASRAKSTFLANMSHELRTPLNAVLGFAQLMARRRGRDPEDLEQLAIIGRAGEHLLGLINDILSLAKIEAGQMSLSPAPFDLVPVLKGLADMLRVRAEGKGVDLVFEPAPGLPSRVVGDESRLRQVLLNLIGNAVKFTEQGSVTLRASWESGRGRFDVRDTGPGIAPEDVARLFQPFVQTAAGERSREGTGLGLAISRNFARLMGGDISVVSEVSRGSTFTVIVDLPVAAEDAVRPPAGAPRRVIGIRPGQPPCRILAVDDVLENRLLLKKLLQSVGLVVQEAANGEQAVEAWRSFRPHLVFMDLRMPVMDGRTATLLIREEEAQSGAPRVKIVALSASALPHERDSFAEWGCDDFLAKPFREEAVFARVAELAGVQFLYDEEPAAGPGDGMADALTAARLAALPSEVRLPLAGALAVGDDEQAKRAAEEVRAHDGPLAEALRQALEQCRLDELLGLLEQAERGDGERGTRA
jgi:predicted ATPase/signal transduction histidine kinase/DNA-binding LytR/AlgR family response regulator